MEKKVETVTMEEIKWKLGLYRDLIALYRDMGKEWKLLFQVI